MESRKALGNVFSRIIKIATTYQAVKNNEDNVWKVFYP